MKNTLLYDMARSGRLAILTTKNRRPGRCMRKATGLTIARTVAGVCLAAGVLVACQPKPPNATGLAAASQTPPAPTQPVVWTRDGGSPAEIQTTQNSIRRTLMHPDRAQFRGVYVLRSDTGISLYCGEVSAQNREGHQIGFVQFAYLPPGLMMPSNDPRFAAAFPSICQPRTVTPGAPGMSSLSLAPMLAR